MLRATAALNHLDDTEDFRTLVQWINRVIAVALVLIFIGVASTTPTVWVRYVTVAFLAMVLVLSRWQLRHSPQRAVIVICAGVWLMSAIASLQFAGVHSTGVFGFAVVIALSGWVLGGSWLMGMSLLTLVFVSGLGLAELMGFFTPTPRTYTAVITTQVVAVLLVIAVLTHLARQSLFNNRDAAVALSLEMALQNDELTAREHEVQIMLHHVPAAIASFDSNHYLRRCNQRYAALFGADPEDLFGHTIQEYVPAETLTELAPYWSRAFAGVEQHYRRGAVHPDTGALRWMDVSLVPEFEDGRTVGLFAMLIDVTDKVAAEQEVKALNVDLERRVERRTSELAHALDTLHASREELVRSQAKASLSALVASVTHELSTPIGNSVLVSSTLQDASRKLHTQLELGQLRKSTLVEINRTLAEGADMLQRNLERAESLLKSFKQVSVDQVSEQRRTFDLASVVAEVVSSLAPSLRNKPHKVVQEIAPDITMDSLPGPLGQVLINLINNAYLHAFEGRSDGLLTISAQVQGKRVLLAVEDNGIGMVEAVQQHLFEPFFTTKIGQGGTGLGMSIVDSIVRKQLGGFMRVTSVLGKGSRFELNLPLVAPAPEANA